MANQRRKRIRAACLGTLGLVGAAAAALPSCMSGPREAFLPVLRDPGPWPLSPDAAGPGCSTLRLLTLNLAHGRRDGVNQVFQKSRTIRANLDRIAIALGRERPDVVAVQEADGPSFWSGRRDHVAYLAARAGFPYAIRGDHVRGMKVRYGTGVLSEHPLRNAVSVTFPPSPPTFSKGFVVATVSWPGLPETEVDVVSVHLDFSRRSVRDRQVREMIARLSKRGRPLIVMGDFNCEAAAREPTLRTLMKALDLRSHQPAAVHLDTFPALGRRLDWILISPALEFVSYRVLPDTLSDHQGVVCEVRRRAAIADFRLPIAD